MATFSTLANRVRAIVDLSGFNMPVNISLLLQEAENEFIRKTFCTEEVREIQSEASTVTFDGTETDITFVPGSGNTKDTITDDSDGFSDDGFEAGKEIVVADSTSNDGTYTISSVADGTLTLVSIGRLTSESGVSGMTISQNQVPYIFALPSDFVKEFRVSYRGIQLEPLSMQTTGEITKSTGKIQTGTPYYYWIEGSYIHITPKPLQSGLLKLWYCKYNTDSTTTSPIIPTIEHYYLPDWVIGTIYELDKNSQMADRFLSKFYSNCESRKVMYASRRFKQRRIADVVGGGGKRTGIENWINIVEEA